MMKNKINDKEVDINKIFIGKEFDSFNRKVKFFINDNGTEIVFDVFITDIALSNIKIEPVIAFIGFVWAYINLYFDENNNNKWIIRTGIRLDSFIEMYNKGEIFLIDLNKCKIIIDY